MRRASAGRRRSASLSGRTLLSTIVASAGEVPTASAKKARASGVSVVTFARTHGVPATVSGPWASGTNCAGPVGAATAVTSPAANALGVPRRGVCRQPPSGCDERVAVLARHGALGALEVHVEEAELEGSKSPVPPCSAAEQVSVPSSPTATGAPACEPRGSTAGSAWPPWKAMHDAACPRPRRQPGEVLQRLVEVEQVVADALAHQHRDVDAPALRDVEGRAVVGVERLAGRRGSRPVASAVAKSWLTWSGSAAYGWAVPTSAVSHSLRATP